MLSEEGKKVKKQLEDFNHTKRMLRNLQDELAFWEDLGNALKSPVLSEKTNGGENTPYAEKRLVKIEELKDKISSIIDEAMLKEDALLQHIDSLDATSKTLLVERYLTGKSLKRIIRESNYSRAQTFRLYNFSFEKIAEKQKDETK